MRRSHRRRADEIAEEEATAYPSKRKPAASQGPGAFGANTFRARLERLRFDPDVAFIPREDLLDGVTIAPLTAPVAAGTPVQAAIFRLAPRGRIARHPATVTQILAVLEGAGRVSGLEGELQPIAAGEAVFWAAGEEHETETEHGLTALILEAGGLRPFRRQS